MRRKAYRITQARFASSAFDGEGARANGGRWNSPGTRMVYASSSLSLAVLEILVHAGDTALVFGRYTVMSMEFDAALVKQVTAGELPREWNAPVITAETQLFGDAWIESQASLLLEVPSVVIPQERNLLLNPDHPDISKLALGEKFPLDTDPRLLR